jgi:hypothetical protein
MKDQIHDYNKTIIIDGPHEDVYSALTTLDGLSEIWEEPVVGDLTINGELTIHFIKRGEENKIRVDRLVFPSSVEWTVTQDETYRGEWEGTKIIFSIKPLTGARSLLNILHLGLTPQLASHEDGVNAWDHFLKKIEELLSPAVPFRL